MKKTLFLILSVCALLGQAFSVHAAPKDADHRKAEIAGMVKDRETRSMIIHQLMSTPAGKKELAAMLKSAAEFRSYYEGHGVNPG